MALDPLPHERRRDHLLAMVNSVLTLAPDTLIKFLSVVVVRWAQTEDYSMYILMRHVVAE